MPALRRRHGINNLRHDVDRLREALQFYSLKRLEDETGISAKTLRGYRDGTTCPTYDAVDRVFNVVLADALKIISRGRPRKEPLDSLPAAAAT